MSQTFNQTLRYINRNFNDKSEVTYTGSSYNLEEAPLDVPLVLVTEWKNANAGTVLMKISRRGSEFIYPESNMIDTGNLDYLCCVLQIGTYKSNNKIELDSADSKSLRELSKYKYKGRSEYIWKEEEEIVVADTLDLVLLNKHVVCLKFNYPEIINKRIKFFIERDSDNTIKLHLATKTEEGYVTYAFSTFMPASFNSRFVNINEFNPDKLYNMLGRTFSTKPSNLNKSSIFS